MPSASGATVSLCMIVRNEERNLPDRLTPIAPLFDEIIIVDTGSTDQTRKIALQFTEKLTDFPWCDDFSAARNESLRTGPGDWIFWLDADDRIPPLQVRSLKTLLKGLRHHKQAYRITTVCALQFECDGAQRITHFRLFRRDPAIQWRGRVHETVKTGFSATGIRDLPTPLAN